MARIGMMTLLAALTGCSVHPRPPLNAPDSERVSVHSRDEELNAWLEKRDIEGTSEIDQVMMQLP